jgi:hypothetical protein
LEAAGFYVDSLPLVAAKDPRRCKYQSWSGLTSSTNVYLLAHKKKQMASIRSTKTGEVITKPGYYFNREPKTFLNNAFAPWCNIFTGVTPVPKGQRLQNVRGEVGSFFV